MCRQPALLIALLLLVLPSGAAAYTVEMHTSEVPYEALPLSTWEPDMAVVVPGTLDGYPETVEFSSPEPFTLQVALWTLPTALDAIPAFTTLIVRDKEGRGVTEVGRQKPASVVWETWREPYSGLSFVAGKTVSYEVASGTYRVEVSTPQNFGNYVLVVGDVSAAAPRLADVRALYAFTDTPSVALWRSPLVYRPVLLLLLMAAAGYLVWRHRLVLRAYMRHWYE